MGLKLGTEEIKCIGLFESMTGAKVVDCILEDDKLIFVVIGRDVGLAIGKKGMNIKKMSEMSGKKIEVIEYSDVPEQFIKRDFQEFAIVLYILGSILRNILCTYNKFNIFIFQCI